jgi:very-short-patch-repair endonuclease
MQRERKVGCAKKEKYIMENHLMIKRSYNLRMKNKRFNTPENILRKELQKLYPLKYSNNYWIGYYIVDFWLRIKNLIIEIDGNGHDKIKDGIRDNYLNRLGFSIIRFTNDEIINNINYCVSRIESYKSISNKEILQKVKLVHTERKKYC